MMDYNWVENDDVGLITQSLKDSVYDRIKPMIGQEKIPFTRKALLVIGKKSDKERV